MHERNVSAVAKLRKEKLQNHRKEIGGEVWNRGGSSGWSI